MSHTKSFPHTTPSGFVYSEPTDWKQLSEWVMNRSQGILECWDEDECAPAETPAMFTIAWNESLRGRETIATLTAERDQQAAQFQRETLRTSELSILLKKVYDSMVLRGPLQNQIGALLNRPLPPLVTLRCACTVEHEGTNIENWVMKLDCPVHKGIIEWARERDESAAKGFEYAEEFRKERDVLRTALEEIERGADHPEGVHIAPAFYEAMEWVGNIAREALGGKS